MFSSRGKDREVDSVVAQTLDRVNFADLREKVKALRADHDISSMMFYI